MSAEEEIARLERRLAALETRTQPWDIISPYLALYSLRAYWPTSAVDSGGSPISDMSGIGAYLTNTGGTQGVTANGISYIGNNGSSSYQHRADETRLDLTSSFTVGIWCSFTNSASATEYVYSKAGNTNADSNWAINRQSSGVVLGVIWSGSTSYSVNSVATVGSATWVQAVLRYTSSSEVALFLNGVKAVNTTSIPASANNSTAALTVGSYNSGAGSWHNGLWAQAWLCMAALSDATITSLYQQTRGAFGV